MARLGLVRAASKEAKPDRARTPDPEGLDRWGYLGEWFVPLGAVQLIPPNRAMGLDGALS